MKCIHLSSLMAVCTKTVRTTQLWHSLVIYSSLLWVNVANGTEATIQQTYTEALKQCEQQFAPAQCQRNATLQYESDKHTLKQQTVLQTHAQRMLKAQQKGSRPPLSQPQTPPEPFNARKPLQQSLPKPTALVLNKPLLVAPKQHSNKQNRALIARVEPKPAIDLAQRQAQSNQKRMQRLAKNAQRREQGFIVDTVAAP
jgi:hypothetical protein